MAFGDGLPPAKSRSDRSKFPQSDRQERKRLWSKSADFCRGCAAWTLILINNPVSHENHGIYGLRGKKNSCELGLMMKLANLAVAILNVVQHLTLAILIQLLVFRFTRSWFAGAFAATAWAVSREITQAEYRWIEAFGHGLRANMPWWGGLDHRVWEKVDPWVDWIAPTIFTFAVAFALTASRHLRKRVGDQG